MPVLRRLARALDGGPRLAAAILYLAGAGLAGWSALVSIGRGANAHALVYLGVAVVLAALCLALLAQARPVEVLTAVVLYASVPGLVGAAAELILGVDAGKAAEIRSLGVDPRTGVLVNLLYFAAAGALAAWLTLRLRRVR